MAVIACSSGDTRRKKGWLLWAVFAFMSMGGLEVQT